MADFLSDEWLDEVDAVLRRTALPTGGSFVVQQVIRDGPDGHQVAFALVVADGAAHLERGVVGGADITFTQDRATAEAIHRGELSARAAFMDGRVRLGGDLRAVIDRAIDLATFDDLFASVRA